jgi:hypothetical protein
MIRKILKSKLANRLAFIVLVAYSWFMWSSMNEIKQKGREISEERESLETELILKVVFNEPKLSNSQKLEKLLERKLYCSKSLSYSYVLMRENEFLEELGVDVETTTTIGAGNSEDAVSISFGIADQNTLKVEFQGLIEALFIEDDPKFEVFDDASTESCNSYF